MDSDQRVFPTKLLWVHFLINFNILGKLINVLQQPPRPLRNLLVWKWLPPAFNARATVHISSSSTTIPAVRPSLWCISIKNKWAMWVWRPSETPSSSCRTFYPRREGAPLVGRKAPRKRLKTLPPARTMSIKNANHALNLGLMKFKFIPYKNAIKSLTFNT